MKLFKGSGVYDDADSANSATFTRSIVPGYTKGGLT